MACGWPGPRWVGICAAGGSVPSGRNGGPWSRIRPRCAAGWSRPIPPSGRRPSTASRETLAFQHRCGAPLVGRPTLLNGWLWGGGVGVGAAEDVGVAEEVAGRWRVRAVLVWRRRRDRAAVDQGLAVGVDGRTHGGVATVHPHRSGILPSGDGVV